MELFPLPQLSSRGDSRGVRRLQENTTDEDIEDGVDTDGTDEWRIEDTVKIPDKDLDEDTFGMSVCSLVRDFHSLVSLPENTPWTIKGARLIRMATSLLLLVCTVALQIFLLIVIKRFVTSKAVHDVRKYYDEYENVMYNCTGVPTNCFKTSNGHWRGFSAYYPSAAEAEKRLDSLPEEVAGNICRISLSQPHFIFVILLLWVFTCLRDIRITWDLTYNIVFMKTVPSMAVALKQERDADDDTADVIIVGITWYVKMVICILMLVRATVTIVLAWLGLRWLSATLRFDDLILNAIALEFILQVKELIYTTLVPKRNKLDVSITKISPYPTRLPPDCWAFVDSIFLLLLAVVVVLFYIR